MANYRGTNMGDSLMGTAGDDWFQGLAGADTIDGGEGSDWSNYVASDAGVKVSLAPGSGPQ